MKVQPEREFHLNWLKRLSADTINFTQRIFRIKGETLLDTVNNILSMKVDMVVMRHSASEHHISWQNIYLQL